MRNFIRNLIFKDPLMSSTPIKITDAFKFEMMYNYKFILFVIILVIFNITLLFLAFSHRNYANLTIGYGILLILTALVLHKIRIMEFLNNNQEKITTDKNISGFLETYNLQVDAMRPHPRTKFFLHSDKFVLPNLKKKSFLFVNKTPNVTVQHQINSPTVQRSDSKHEMKNNMPISNQKNLAEFYGQEGNLNFQNYNLKSNEKVSNRLNRNATKNHDEQVRRNLQDTKEQTLQREQFQKIDLINSVLHNFKNILGLIAKNEIEFITYYDNLLKRKQIIDKLIINFGYDLDKFIKLSDVIASELYALNSSPKYFRSEYNNLKIEIGKFFAINRDILSYKEKTTLPKTLDKMLALNINNQNTEFALNNENMFSKIFVLRYVFMCIALISVIFICLSLLEVFTLYTSFYYIILIMLSFFSFSCFVFLIYTNNLDRSCQSGKKAGCTMIFNNHAKYNVFFKQKDLIKEVNELKTDIYNFVEKNKSSTKHFQHFVSELSSENMKYKILVFKNLFEKLYYVKNEFSDIIKHKINTNGYYKHIDNMERILDQILFQLQDKIKDSFLNFFLNEVSYGFFVENEMKIIIDNVVYLTTHKKFEEENKLRGKCSEITSKICAFKDHSDDIFNCIVFLTIIILICLF